MGERGSPGGAWAARDEASWWAGNGGELQQQLTEDAARSTAPSTQQLFTYKMAGGFNNVNTGESSSPAYDYRIVNGQVSRSGDTNMQQPWWYSASSIDSQQQTPSPREQSSPQSHSTQQTNSSQNQSIHQGQPSLQTIQHNQQQNLQQVLQQHQTLQQHIQAVQQQHIQSALKQQQQPTLQELQQQVQQQALLQQRALIAQAAARKMPRGRADCKPRGRMTAYAFFVQTCREEHKKKHPDENVVFAAFSKKCAERWSTMLESEKQRFHDMAEKDKRRYDLEMQNYVPPKDDKARGRRRKQIKDPNAPKRSLSAFFWFCNEERSKVKAINPEYSMGDIAKELGRRWAACDPQAKSKYEQLSEKDKARYDREMTEYKRKPLLPPQLGEDDIEEEVYG